MISDFRKHLDSSAYKSVLWIIALSMAGAFSIPAIVKTLFTETQPWSIKINGKPISPKEFSYEVRQKAYMIEQFKKQYGQYADYLLQYMGFSSDPRVMATDELVKEHMLFSCAKAMGIELHEDFIRKMLHNKKFAMQELSFLLPPFVFEASGILNKQKLLQFLSAQGMDVAQFDKKVERILTNRMISDIVVASDYTPQFELREEAAQELATRSFTIASVSFDDILAQVKEKPLDQLEIKQYFEQKNSQSQKYTVPEKRSAKVWELNPSSYNIQVSQNERADYYQDNKEKLFVKTPLQVEVRFILIKNTDDQKALEKIETIYQKVKHDPQQFSAIAQQESQDEQSRSSGGLLAAFAKGEKERELERAAFTLKKDGDISNVFQTKNGYGIVQRVAKHEKTYVPLKDVDEEITKKIQSERFKVLFSKEMKIMLEEGDSIDQALEQMAQQRGIVSTDLPLKTQDESKMMVTLFKLREPGQVGYFFEGTTGIVIRLQAIQDQYTPSLDEISQVVANDMYEDRAKEELHRTIIGLKEEARQSSMEVAAKKYQATLSTITDVIAGKTKKIAALEQLDIPIATVMRMTRIGTFFTNESPRFWALIRLDSAVVDQNAITPEVAKKITEQRNNLFVQGFIASLCRNVTIETNDTSKTAREDFLL